MNQIDYLRVIFAAFFTPWGRHETGAVDWGSRLLLHGPPGSRKTAIMREIAIMLGIFFYSLKPGAKGQGGFAVTPVPMEFTKPNGDKHMLLIFPGPDWVAEIGDNPALVLVDEMNTAAPALQAPLLGLCQEKELGSTHMGPRTRVFGCTNSVEDAAGGWDLAPAIANRLGHIQWRDPDIDEWCEYMIRGADPLEVVEKVDVADEEARVLQAWPHAWASATGFITSFLKSKRSAFRKQPKKHEPQSSQAWASPRTWEYAIRMLATSQIHGLTESETDMLIGSYIGEAVTTELATFRNNQDLPDPAELLDGKVKFKHNPHRLDRTMVVLNSCASLVAPKGAHDRVARATRLWMLLDGLLDEVKDLVIPVASTLFKSNLSGPREATKVLAAVKSSLIVTERAKRRR